MNFGNFYLDLAKKLRRETKVPVPLLMTGEALFVSDPRKKKKEKTQTTENIYTLHLFTQKWVFHFPLCPSEIKAILILGQERWSPTQTRKILQDTQNKERESKLEPDFAKHCLTHSCESCLAPVLVRKSIWEFQLITV